ncbi:glycosyltransferase family 2 protein [Lichenicoccus sp.]|uniref:glycosyltransferase family 2 protein n=1 Tax=Lichenicoccus sp. TaxID=2781899 RepID=UPI003D142FA6
MPTLPTEKPDTVPVSVIIANYNYADFIAAAIDSALALRWPDVEVIVVDDGSTDRSRQVIASYGDRVSALFQSNQGQVGACNNGYAASRGEWIIFLDSDDMLHPDLLQEAAKKWGPGVSKIQSQMLRVDAKGNSLGTVFPQYKVPPTPVLIRRWATRTSAYPTPPGSGNIYARCFLDNIFPLEEGRWDFVDSPCLATAAYFGDVETLALPLVYYRMHGKNDSQMVEFNVDLTVRDIERARKRFTFAQQIARSRGMRIDSKAIFRSLSFAAYRIVSFRFAAKRHPITSDSRGRIIYDAIRAGCSPQGLALTASAVLVFWILLVAVAPARLAKLLISWRYIPSSRPVRIAKTLRILDASLRPA